MLIGLIIGAASGAVQFWMLARFTKAVTAGWLDKKTLLFGVCQFFLPLAVLLCFAFLFSDALIWAAIGMAAILISCSLVKFFILKKT